MRPFAWPDKWGPAHASLSATASRSAAGAPTGARTRPLVGELQDEGLLELVADASDARARLVCFTPQGIAAIRRGMGILREVEEELAEAVGAARLERLGRDLGALLDALERRG